MNRPTISLLILLATAAGMLNACSSSEDADPVGPGTPPPPLAITDLAVIAGTSASITLAWTSPQYADKATIRYDLRYIAFGSESQDWGTWTVDRTTLFVNIEGTGDYATIEEAVLAATIGDLVLVGPGHYTWANQATGVEGTDQEGWSGGGLNLHLSDTVVRNCIFTGNEATQGGGLWVGGQGDAIIENCLFENNKGRDGGGVFLINSEPRITMRDCTIRNNHATFKGGGLLAYNVAATLENLLIVGNDSSDKGGGPFLHT